MVRQLREILYSIVRVVLTTTNGGATSFELSIEPYNSHNLAEIPLEKLYHNLSATIAYGQEIARHYPSLESSYVRKRQWLSLSAMELASAHLLSGCRKVLIGRTAGPATPFFAQFIIVSKAIMLGCIYRLARPFMIVAPTAITKRLDQTIVWLAMWFVAQAKSVSATLKRIADAAELQQRGWSSLETFGISQITDKNVLSQVRDSLFWSSPTYVSRLVALSTFRDNNTGIYRHPGLAAKYSPDAIDRMLSQFHREACEELFRLQFSELVEEIRLYADQAVPGRYELLRTWKRIRPYRLIQPTELDPFTSRCFELTLDTAVAALDLRS